MRIAIFVVMVMVCFVASNMVYAGNDYVKYQRYQEFERTSSPEKIKRGAAVYQANCVRCHGADGTRSPRRDVKAISYMHPAKVFEDLVDYKTENDLFEWDERPMIDVTQKLSYPDLEAVALYVGTLRK